MSRFKWAASLAIVYLASAAALAQDHSARAWSIGVSPHAGLMVPQYSYLDDIVTGPLGGLEVSARRRARPGGYYAERFRRPGYGVAARYTSLGNAGTLGEEWAVTGFVDYAWTTREGLRPYTYLGLGAAYVTRHFHLRDNYRNVLIGSPLNLHFTLRTGLRYAPTPTLALTAALSLEHLSNANATYPNKGLNYLTLGFGVEYRPGGQRAPQPGASPLDASPPELPRYRRGLGLEVSAYAGRYVDRYFGAPAYLTGALSAAAVWRRSPTLSWGLGADFFYHPAQASSRDGLRGARDRSDAYQPGAYAMVRVHYARLTMDFHTGAYLGLGGRAASLPVYQRAVLAYEVRPRVAVALSLKSHVVELDLAQVGLRYRLPS